MNPQAIVEQAYALEITLTVAGDRIRYFPKSRTPSDLVTLLKEHKQELMAYLCEQLEAEGLPRTQNPQYPRNNYPGWSPVEPGQAEVEHLLAWASELAEQDLVLPEPVTFTEAQLRIITTERVSHYAARCLNAISYFRLMQNTGGLGQFDSKWCRERIEDSLGALAALREALERRIYEQERQP